MSSILLAYVAGVVTILSPCILPLLPIVLAGAVHQHRLGPVALAGGLVISFTLVGLFIATAGVALGLTPKVLNHIAAGVMIAFGVIMLSEPLQARFAMVATAATSGLATRTASYSGDGLAGQFVLGSILGAVWTPCVGPTLGAAIALASQGQSIPYAATVMLAFAIGTVTPLIFLMTATRNAAARNKQTMQRYAAILKPALGALLVLVGLLFLTGLMSTWEAFVLERMPDWLIGLIYSI
ncbi:MAG: cytochrome C biogenesis protein [Hyphomicrobium sp.]|nr:MAG: cytochrome C biogenesis protein [Hyphomicrobium sp.]PPC99742.1 MAG: cytochrome C biogenesis protein [Hyphomicrobium sp.]